ncbi:MULTISPECIES: hypothetical protein [Aeribacillus]|nr:MULTISPECIES: hypothetical protein [Aeribacillus]MED0651959.1 hypothetical protein [Aeribacillus composti]MED4485393.1 hypothetical protein [Aeribacillus pallidus]
MQLLLAKAPIVLTLTSRAKGTEKHAKKVFKTIVEFRVHFICGGF